MHYWGSRSQAQQYVPKPGVKRPAWSYRAARRNLARVMHWPDRYRWRIWWRGVKAALAAKLAGEPKPA
jgi:hypothetical protein